MATLVLSLVAGRTFASLGESSEQITAKYGEQQPVHPQYDNASMAVYELDHALYFGLPEDISKDIGKLVKALRWEDADLRGYRVGAYRVSCVLLKDHSVFESYSRAGSLSDKEIQALLDVNSGGLAWEKGSVDQAVASSLQRWTINDRKTHKPLRLAVLNGSTLAFFSADVVRYIVDSANRLVAAEEKKQNDDLNALIGRTGKGEGVPADVPDRDGSLVGAATPAGARLGASDVSDWNLERVQRAIDEIYARHGVVFPNYQKQAWAESQSWYHRVPGLKADAAEASFTDDEKSNVEVLAARRIALRAPETKPAAQSAMAAALQSSPSVVRRPPEKTWDRPHVYIQLADESQRGTATALKQKLAKSGCVVEGIENSKGHPHVPTQMSELNYFSAADSPEAAKIAKDLAAFFQPAGIHAVVPEGNSYVSHARQYEIWFAPSVH